MLGTDSDQDFDPTAEMLVNDFDDEHTLDEEEAITDETNEEEEIDDLQKACIHLINWFLIFYNNYCL